MDLTIFDCEHLNWPNDQTDDHIQVTESGQQETTFFDQIIQFVQWHITTCLTTCMNKCFSILRHFLASCFFFNATDSWYVYSMWISAYSFRVLHCQLCLLLTFTTIEILGWHSISKVQPVQTFTLPAGDICYSPRHKVVSELPTLLHFVTNVVLYT